jgi:hypothetical protein
MPADMDDANEQTADVCAAERLVKKRVLPVEKCRIFYMSIKVFCI